jgi:hypothetical protein
MFASVNPDVFLKQQDGRSAAEVGTLARNDTRSRNNESYVITPFTTRWKSDSTMDPVLNQVKSVTSKKYHERFQSTLGMAIPVGQLPKWFSNDTDIGDDEIESTFTKLTEAFSVNTDEKKKFLSFFAHIMDSVGKLEELENAFIKNKKKSHPKKHGGNVHIISDAGCDADGDDEDCDGQSCSTDGFNNVKGLVKNPASEDSESSESWDDEMKPGDNEEGDTAEEEEDDGEVGSG